MEKAKSFRDLIVWQKAHAFVLDIYHLTDSFPKSELFGITSQLRRAAASIAAKIAEGFRKKSVAEKIRFLNISQGSADECSYFLILAKDLNYADTDELAQQLDEVSRLLQGYLNSIIKFNSKEAQR
jgi:four helix bundle protein